MNIDSRKDFETFIFGLLGQSLLSGVYERQINGEHLAQRTWQACQAVNDERIRRLLAVIQLKDEALQEVDMQLESGFVRCETCGSQEDTKDFDCRNWISDGLAASPENTKFMEVSEILDYKGTTFISIGGLLNLAPGTKLYVIKSSEAHTS